LSYGAGSVDNTEVCVVMQPTYLPWMGYFDLMDQSTIFVFLDNVQFAKQTWQQRNRIRTAKGFDWLTVPIKIKGLHLQRIDQVTIVPDKSFPRKHMRVLELNYRRAAYFHNYWPGLSKILSAGDTSLAALNIRLVRWMADEMGLDTRFEVASGMRLEGKRSELLVDICGKVGAKTYLSPIGSADYLVEDQGLFRDNDIQVLLHNYEHPTYTQVFEPFIPYTSAIDLLLNEGEKALDIIRSGRRQPLSLEDLIERRSL
jgi:hypothetical protein